jgi:hypothetical protein
MKLKTPIGVSQGAMMNIRHEVFLLIGIVAAVGVCVIFLNALMLGVSLFY